MFQPIDINQYRFAGSLSEHHTRTDTVIKPRTLLDECVAHIRSRQEVLYADASRALLVVFQGMDCAGKDSTIKHVFSGVNPQGVHVANFSEPTRNETAHSYMWRYWRQMPRRGQIGVFNRSHYEEVLVMRVHPELLAERKMPKVAVDDQFWSTRLQDLVALETHLERNGVHVIKIMLHLSKEEQRRRLLGRINRPHKNWKFDPRDLAARAQWDAYTEAYNAALVATDRDACPWYVVPADHKPTLRAITAAIVAIHLDRLPVTIPTMSAAVAAQLEQAKIALESERPEP